MLIIKGCYPALIVIAVLAVLLGGLNCQDRGATSQSDYLLRVGQRTITIEAFQKALRLARSDELVEVDPAETNWTALRIQLLNQLIVSNLLLQRAEALELSITTQELREAQEEIIADYPPGEFEKTLLQQAIDYDEWSAALAERLLIQKVIDLDLKAAEPLTEEDYKSLDTDQLVQYLQAGSQDADATRSETAAADRPLTDPDALLAYMQLTKKQNAFDVYIDSLKQEYPVEINIAAWNQLPSQTGDLQADDDQSISNLSTDTKE